MKHFAEQAGVFVSDRPSDLLDRLVGEFEHFSCLADAQLHREGHTIVLVTHDPSVAEVADRVITLKDGRIVSDVRRAASGNALSGPLEKSNATSMARLSGVRFQVLRSAIAMGLTSIVRKRLQSGLTMLGIMIGIGSVFTMLTVGAAGNRQVIKNIECLGAEIITISRGPPGVRGAERKVVSLSWSPQMF